MSSVTIIFKSILVVCLQLILSFKKKTLCNRKTNNSQKWIILVLCFLKLRYQLNSYRKSKNSGNNSSIKPVHLFILRLGYDLVFKIWVRRLFLLIVFHRCLFPPVAFIWLKYCRYDKKHYTIAQIFPLCVRHSCVQETKVFLNKG